MAVKPETRIVKRIIERLRQWPNAFVVKLTTGGYQVSGLPDVLAVLSGRVALIEVKRRRPHESLIAARRNYN